MISKNALFENDSIWIISGLGMTAVFILVILTTTLYTLNRPMPVTDASVLSDAQKRLDLVNAMLRTQFGQSWPYVLIGFAVLLIGLVILLLRSGETEHALQLDEQAGIRLLLVVVCVLILVAIGVFLLFLNAYLFPNQDSSVFTTTDDEAQTRQKQVYTIALVLVVLFSLALVLGIFGYLRRNRA